MYIHTHTYIHTYIHTHIEAQRGILRKNVAKYGRWPADKHELITNHLDSLLNYIESIDFDRL